MFFWAKLFALPRMRPPRQAGDLVSGGGISGGRSGSLETDRKANGFYSAAYVRYDAAFKATEA
jgi:hypothetical protein